MLGPTDVSSSEGMGGGDVQKQQQDCQKNVPGRERRGA